MSVEWLEMTERLAAGARAKVAEDRRRLEELQAKKDGARGDIETSAPIDEPPGSDRQNISKKEPPPRDRSTTLPRIS